MRLLRNFPLYDTWEKHMRLSLRALLALTVFRIWGLPTRMNFEDIT